MPAWYLAEGVSLYEQHGRHQNGLSFDEQDEEYWRQIKIMQRMIVWELMKATGQTDSDWYTSDEEDELAAADAEPEPMALTLEML